MENLGKLERVEDLRTIWPNEAKNFTKWLMREDSLALLSETVGIDIVLEESESPASSCEPVFFLGARGSCNSGRAVPCRIVVSARGLPGRRGAGVGRAS